VSESCGRRRAGRCNERAVSAFLTTVHSHNSLITINASNAFSGVNIRTETGPRCWSFSMQRAASWRNPFGRRDMRPAPDCGDHPCPGYKRGISGPPPDPRKVTQLTLGTCRSA
jgi:hypothetical protein